MCLIFSPKYAFEEPGAVQGTLLVEHETIDLFPLYAMLGILLGTLQRVGGDPNHSWVCFVGKQHMKRSSVAMIKTSQG